MNQISVNYKYSEIIFNDRYCLQEEEALWNAYRTRWFEVPTKQIVTDFPMHLDVETTNACNLKCPMCPRTQLIMLGKYPKRRDMSIETFQRIIDQGKEKSLYAINLNSSGEPLFNSVLSDMVAIAKKNGVLDTMFHTNATLLDESVSEKLIHAGLNRLIVSFDSPIKEHYERIRKGACFESVAENIRRFIRIRNATGSPIPHVRINMVLMKDNAGQKEQLVAFWRDCVDSIGFLQYINFYGMDNKDRRIPTDQGTYDESHICEKLYQRLAVTEDGRIKLCHMDDEGREILGHIDRDEISALWRGAKMNHFRTSQTRGRITKLSMCRDCGVPRK